MGVYAGETIRGLCGNVGVIVYLAIWPSILFPFRKSKTERVDFFVPLQECPLYNKYRTVSSSHLLFTKMSFIFFFLTGIRLACAKRTRGTKGLIMGTK